MYLVNCGMNKKRPKRFTASPKSSYINIIGTKSHCLVTRSKSQETRGKSQESRAKRQEARGERQEARGKSQRDKRQEPRTKSQEPWGKSQRGKRQINDLCGLTVDPLRICTFCTFECQKLCILYNAGIYNSGYSYLVFFCWSLGDCSWEAASLLRLQ